MTDTKKCGIVGAVGSHVRMHRVTTMTEKLDPEVTPSTLAVIGRYVLGSEIFEGVKNVQEGVGGEIQLTDVVAFQLH